MAKGKIRINKSELENAVKDMPECGLFLRTFFRVVGDYDIETGLRCYLCMLVRKRIVGESEVAPYVRRLCSYHLVDIFSDVTGFKIYFDE